MDLKDRAQQGVKQAKAFNRRPPVWAVILTGVVIVIAVKLLFVIAG